MSVTEKHIVLVARPGYRLAMNQMMTEIELEVDLIQLTADLKGVINDLDLMLTINR